MLKEAGFTYDEPIGAWLNLAAGRVIAFDGAAQRTPEWVADLLARLAPPKQQESVCPKT
jgi:hypothetical protein